MSPSRRLTIKYMGQQWEMILWQIQKTYIIFKLEPTRLATKIEIKN